MRSSFMHPDFVKSTINQAFTQIDDSPLPRKEQNALKLNFIVMLKHWSNPHWCTDNSITRVILTYPALLKTISPLREAIQQAIQDDNKTELEEIRRQINQTVEDIIQAHGLTQLFNSYINKCVWAQNAAEQEKLQKKWWEGQLQNQKEIANKYDNLAKDQKKFLRNQFTPDRVTKKHVSLQAASHTYSESPLPNYIDYFWMTHYSPELQSFATRRANNNGHLDSDLLTIVPMVSTAGVIAFSVVGAIVQGALGATVGIAGIIGSGAIGGLYALKKAFNSVTNFLTGNKMLRSLFRLLGIGGGAYGGFVLGGMAGAALGSIVPGIGTVIGATLGMIFGAGLGAGIGASVTKYTARLISYLYYKNDKDVINPTNPDKYRLTKKQQSNLEKKGFDVAGIKRLISAIKTKKDSIDIMKSIPFTDQRKEKNALNKILKSVKKGTFSNEVTIDHTTYYYGNSSMFKIKTPEDTQQQPSISPINRPSA